MSARRPPSAPPSLPGFEYIRLLGSGGFADVFLYQQLLPRRQVAVKVMLSDKLGADTVSQFTDEANLMAQLATHPSIVSIYQAGISGEGRPYLVMEYCSRPNLQVRYRRERFSEAEALRIGVQIAGAVETAHRAGILHRDIKPANILVTEYGRPALTDFGIAATTTSEVEATGMSIPWSPPESFASPARGDATSDVYALGATLYTLLAGRSPFEMAGVSNGAIELIGRVSSAPVPPVGRADVSAAFEEVLRTAMAKQPGDRFPTAMAFAHELQRTQIGLGLQATPIDVAEDELLLDEGADDDDGRTRIRSIVTINAQSPVAPAPQRERHAAPAGDGDQDVAATLSRPPATPRPAPIAPPSAPPVADTVMRQAPSEPPAAAQQPSARPRRGLLIAGAAVVGVVVVGGVLGGILAAPGATNASKQDAAQSAPAPVDLGPAGGVVPAIPAVTGKPEAAKVVFTWKNPDPKEGDAYLWHTVEQGSSSALAPTSEPTVTVPASASGRTCVEVILRRSTGRTSDSATLGCVP